MDTQTIIDNQISSPAIQAREPLTIVAFLWRHGQGRQQFLPQHANTWARMIDRCLNREHRIVLVTDQLDADYDPLIKTVPLWQDWRILNNPTWSDRSACYPRLKLFAADAAATFGEWIVCMDLDCIATDWLDPLFDRDEDFVILRRDPVRADEAPSTYQGALWMLRAGARPQVWDDFHGRLSVDAARKYLGSDQAWLRHCLGPDEAGWSAADGVYCTRNLNPYDQAPPANARLIFFNNGAKPWDYGRTGNCRECRRPISTALRVRCPHCKTINIQPPQGWIKDYWQ